MKKIASAVSALFLFLSFAFCANADFVAVDTIESGFPQGQVIDVLGFNVGMTTQDLLADTFKEKYSSTVGSFSVQAQLEDGFSITFPEAKSFISMRSLDPSQNSEILTFVLGSPATGNAVQAIHRASNMKEPVNTDSLVKALTEKYGEPSHVDVIPSVFVNIYYIFNADGLIKDADYHHAGFCTNFRDLMRPMYFSNSGGVPFNNAGKYYTHSTDRQDPSLGDNSCTAVIYIKLWGDIMIQGSTSIMEMTFIDNQAIYQDMTAIDAAVQEAFLKAPVKTDAPLPKL